ncbi:MAG: hypothetical protein KAT35_02245, partial [Candidatus Aenigmarchaeota archaeon]|nr:hypothetical protein [Candidatus Aenigmarchaeota archaeon]
MDIEKIRAESDLAKRAELIAKDIHHGEKRRNEEPYITHPRKLVKECSPCLKESEYRDSTRAAGWVHDSPENKEEFTIDILGELLRDFGKKGRYTTYMVDRCTKRESEEKYVIKTLNLHESGVKKDLDLHAM